MTKEEKTAIIKAQLEIFQKIRTYAISEMFNNHTNGIYSTTKFFSKIDSVFINSMQLLADLLE